MFDKSQPIELTKHTITKPSAPTKPSPAPEKNAADSQVSEPEKPIAPSPRKPGARRRLTNLNKLTDPDSRNPLPIKEDTAQETNLPLEDQPVDQNQLENCWRKFAQAQENFVAQTLLAVIPRIKEGNVITVNVENTFQEEAISDTMQTLMPYLRKQLNNTKLTISTKVSADLESTRAFTPREKLQEMIKENPNLKLLIDKFGLEVE